KGTPVFSENVKNVWAKFSIINKTSSDLYLKISYTNISSVLLYDLDSNNLQLLGKEGNSVPVKTFKPGNPNIIFKMNATKNKVKTYVLQVSSIHPIILPIYISTSPALITTSSIENLSIGFYFGLLAIIFFYNLFLYLSTKDINYLLYIIFIFCLITAQLAASGYGYYYLWPNRTGWNEYAVLWTSYFSGISAFAFSISFLRIRHFAKKTYPLLLFIFVVYLAGLILSLFKYYSLSYSILNYNSLFNGMLILLISIYIVKQGHKSALFYLIAWSAFLISVVILVLRNINILPYNNFTSLALYIGSSVEVTLLSIALADRINILKKEKDLSHAEALEQARKNERLVNEQNIILEERVLNRTVELQNANHHLNEALNNLKDAQTQLVEAEKMASLGQLTAGIAHEINNPINFVKSNINPLRLDVKDLLEVLHAYDELHVLKDTGNFKQELDKIQNLKDEIDINYVQGEIDNLIAGIEEGAERTAEIVRGLRTFSRIDEASLKTVNVHDGILSTIVLLKNTIPYYVKVVKEFNAEGVIECFPGKLNQVFMNIITNGIQAIKPKPVKEDESIIIKTTDTDDGCIEISIKDSGIGMDEETKHRIFEPFFTTKDVGEGTGLGMAIVFKIIQKHLGKINIKSSPGQGAEFIITLPHKYKGDD
ncbi:7TM diverse intracellular signaling domain-containing protein, partial [Parafilimonas sp.]|uniref:sensor histidine kinase n=1 Tax=Parafilimonas sp. TaxID=1969739 RepID=UPI0039E5561C